jgi:tetratricopeptide (TPR) repeat protein
LHSDQSNCRPFATLASARVAFFGSYLFFKLDVLIGPSSLVLKEPGDISRVYNRLGWIYLRGCGQKQANAILAKSMFLRACEAHATAASWAGVGLSCLRLKEMTDAEDAFSEANILNNKDPDVWGYLALLCLTQNRVFEANQAIKQAMKCGLSNAELYSYVEVSFRYPFIFLFLTFSFSVP